MLTAAELESMRAVQAQALPDVAVHRRASMVRDGFGGSTEVWQTIGAPRPARVGVPTKAELAMFADRPAEQTAWTVTVASGVDVRSGDRLVVGARTFHVAANPVRSWGTATRAVCWEVR